MAGRRHSKTYKVCAVIPRYTLRGDGPSPADPPGQSLGSAALWSAVAKGLVSRTLALTGIEPVPAERNGSPLHRDTGRLRLSLDPSSRVVIAPPCNPRPGLSRPGPRPVFRHRRRPEGDVGSPFRTPH